MQQVKENIFTLVKFPFLKLRSIHCDIQTIITTLSVILALVLASTGVELF
jgi:hypothetical protein